MKSLRVVLLSAVSLLAAGSMFAQTADEIVNKHVEAVGGKAKISGIKTLYTEYDLEVMNNPASGVTYIMNGKGFRNEMDFGGQKIVQCITDKGGWMINPLAGQTTPQALPADQVKASQSQYNVGGPLFDYAAKGNKVELQGRENIGAVNAFKLKVTSKDSVETTVWVDPSTYYILKTNNKMTVAGQDVESSATFSNYKKSDYGFVMPVNTELSVQGMTIILTNKKVEINKELDPKLFEMQQ